MKIAIIGPYFLPQNFGIEKVMLNHATYLAARGHHVTVITSRLAFPTGSFADLPSREVVDGFTIIRLEVLIRAPPTRLLSYPSRGGLFVRGIRRALEAADPDIVHAHNVGAPAWAEAGARFCDRYGRSFFYSLYFHTGKLKLDWVRKLLIRRMNALPLRTAKAIFMQTMFDYEPLLQDFQIIAPQHLAVLPNGVMPPQCERDEDLPSGKIRLLFVGRVDDHRKGFDVLETALEGLEPSQREQISLRVIGTISEARRQDLSAKFSGLISIAGNVTEAVLEAAYASSDIFVMPSRYEGFGMPYIEAMRYGLAVIGSRAGGIPHVVPEGTGMLVPPGDPVALREAIAAMIESRSFHQYSEAARAWARTFEWPGVIDRLEAFYRSHAGAAGS